MKFYYDTKTYYPYLCFKETSEGELKKLVVHLSSNNLQPNKYYTAPKYPASDGISYDYLFRLPFDENIAKPSHQKVSAIMDEFLLKINTPFVKEEVKSETVELLQFLQSERRNLKQIKSMLTSERKILDQDKTFFATQMDNLNKLAKTLREENTKIVQSFDSLGSKLNNEIDKLFSKKEFQSEDMQRLQESLNEREKRIKEREKITFELQKELLKQEKDFEKYREKQEKIYVERVESLKAEVLGITQDVEQIDANPFSNLKILILGKSMIQKNEIMECFQQAFFKNFDLDLPVNCLDIPTLNYDEVKNINIAKKLKPNKFDYIIFGPRPHSLKGVDLKKGIPTLKKDWNLKAIIRDEPDKALSKSLISELSISIANDWKHRFNSI